MYRGRLNKKWAPGLVNFVPAVADLFLLAEAFTQPGVLFFQSFLCHIGTCVRVRQSRVHKMYILYVPGMVESSVAAKAMTIISFCKFPSLSSKLARSKRFIFSSLRSNIHQ